MSLAEKFTYLNDTKERIRQAINAKGGALTPEDVFREYAKAIEELALGESAGLRRVIPADALLLGDSVRFSPKSAVTDSVFFGDAAAARALPPKNSDAPDKAALSDSVTVKLV